jgi:hypothetical protein
MQRNGITIISELLCLHVFLRMCLIFLCAVGFYVTLRFVFADSQEKEYYTFSVSQPLGILR